MRASETDIKDYFGKLNEIKPIVKEDEKRRLIMLFIGLKVSHIFQQDVESAKVARLLHRINPNFDYKKELDKNHTESMNTLNEYNSEIKRVIGQDQTWQSCLEYSKSGEADSLRIAFNKLCADKMGKSILVAENVMESDAPDRDVAMFIIGTTINGLLLDCSNQFEEFGVTLYVKSLKKIYKVTKRHWQNCLRFSQGKRGNEVKENMIKYFTSVKNQPE